jgi:succinyl-CoA--D-citramalate CoA-transferase
MSLTGSSDGPPMRSGVYLSDYVTGIYTALGIAAALNARHLSGRGQVVETSLLDSVLSLLLTAIPEYRLLNHEATRCGNRDRYSSPSSAYKTAEGDWIFLAAGNDIGFPRLCKAMGRPEIAADSRFDSMKKRLAHFDELAALITGWMGCLNTADALRILADNEVPCAKINSIGDMLQNKQVQMPGRLIEIDHPVIGKIPMHGFAVSLSDTPTSLRRHAPVFGEHTEEIFKTWLQGAKE